MPLPSNENDLKRRARRRLIGAVALTLLAVIMLPLLLEDEPPPVSSLAVRMAAKPVIPPEPTIQPAQPVEPVVVPTPSVPAEPEVQPAALPKPVSKPEPVKPAPPKPEPPKLPPAKPAAVPQPPAQSTTAASEIFVVQLAALSDATKAEALRERAAKTGLPAFTDKVGKLTRVRVGPFTTRTAAVAAAVKLAEHKMAGQVLVQ